MECRWNAGGRVRMRLRRLPSEDERFRRAAAVAAVAAVRHVGMSACRHVGGATGGALRCPVLRGAARDRGSGDAARPASAARIESRATGGSCAIAPNRGDIRDADREGAWRKKRGGARLSSWKAGRLEGWKAGRLEGGKAGRREGGKAGRREGGKAWDGVRPFAPSYVVVHRDEGRGAHYRRGRWQRPGSSRVNRRRALGGFGFGCVGTACVRLKRVTCPHPAACRARSPMRWRRRAPSAAWILLEPRSNPDLIPRERRAPRRPVSPAMRCGPPNAGRMFRAALYLRPRYCSVQMCVKCLIDVCARICALSRYATTNAYGL
ncbi:Uncharacterised protein [Burkholderia pseudomallei]|nr:Uncharacterised protein [Burkholderia pseudomallei]CAJ9330690.1 Uncharacterised protein [Burkholderia pseudomallei]VBE25661.1 Uncharacterised protein [Burkholderia pseudomallei]VBE93636.1 Uncharacterised protein [Burkholderia pseudomallei]VBN69219.1 Uncharacterised protein [Burkholderia pseudomallei]